MDEQSWLTERFEENRPRLRGVAYRMLGSLSEAEDAVQEAWLRLSRIDAATVGNLGGWLTTVVSRVCLDSGPNTPCATTARWGPDTYMRAWLTIGRVAAEHRRSV